MYLIGQLRSSIRGVSLLVWFLRAGGVKVDFTSSFGIIALCVGGLSSALLGSLASIGYYQSSFKQVLRSFKSRQFCLLFGARFLLLDFFPFIFGGGHHSIISLASNL